MISVVQFASFMFHILLHHRTLSGNWWTFLRFDEYAEALPFFGQFYCFIVKDVKEFRERITGL